MTKSEYYSLYPGLALLDDLAKLVNYGKAVEAQKPVKPLVWLSRHPLNSEHN